MWKDERGVNLLDTGRAYYDVYQCADGEWVVVGALEPEFFAVLKERMGLECGQHDPGLRDELEAAFLRHSREHWTNILQQSDACFAPILSLSEAPSHPHNAMRGTFLNISGVTQPAPAPRFLSKDPD
jgi:alpha-methylacyl-CoA racemase